MKPLLARACLPALLAVAATAVPARPLAATQAEVGLRLPVSLELLGRPPQGRPVFIFRLVPPRPGEVIDLVDYEKRVTGVFAGMPAHGTARVKWRLHFVSWATQARPSVEDFRLSTDAGSVHLEFGPSTPPDAVLEAAQATGVFAGAAVRGIVAIRDLEKQRSSVSGFVVVAGNREELVSRLREAAPQAAELAAAAETALLPFPLAAVRGGGGTAARVRVWRTDRGSAFEMYVLVGVGGQAGSARRIRVVTAGPGTGERVALEGDYAPGTQVRVTGPVPLPGMILVLEDGRVVLQFPVSEAGQ
mgnify:CR=1 FL=1